MNTTKFRGYNVPAHRTPSFFDDFVTRDFFGNRFANSSSVPAANVKESDEKFTIEIASPGMDKSDFHVNIEDKTLTISSEKKSEVKNENEKFTRVEFAYNSFSRSFRVPEIVDAEAVKASYENGILRIELPKKSEAIRNNKKQIEIA